MLDRCIGADRRLVDKHQPGCGSLSSFCGWWTTGAAFTSISHPVPKQSGDSLNWRLKSRRRPTPIAGLAQQVARYDELGGFGLRMAK
jgi:hypothetical protein